MKRRTLLRIAGTATTVAGLLPISLVRLAPGPTREAFSFAFIADSHLQQLRGNRFARTWDRSLLRAVGEANQLDPKPDFVVFGGDLAERGTPAELDHGAELLSALRCPVHMVVGEHDYYHDLGRHWRRLFGPEFYSFDHRGVHFVVLNSVRADDAWSSRRWESGAHRMAAMAEHPESAAAAFRVGAAQRRWLAEDLARVPRATPVVVFSHAPLQRLFRPWNYWTEDADEIHRLLAPFANVSVIYGHVHQIQHRRLGNIAFSSALATAWPSPCPPLVGETGSHLPVLTVPLNRAEESDERDATGWQWLDVHSGRVDVAYTLRDGEQRRLDRSLVSRR